MIRTRVLVAAIGGVASLAVNARAQTVDVDATLRRAGQYVVEFERQLSGIVAEESYRQTDLPLGREVELKSDLLMVRPVGSDHYVGFRDVFEMNRRAVRDREDRLFKLFLDPSAATARQAQAIAQESSRFNIGDIERNVNVPTFALSILDPQNQPRFRFKTTSIRRAELIDVAAPGAAVIEYDERQHPTMIHNTAGDDAPSRGRFWLDAAGRALASEIVTESPGKRVPERVIATIDVAYRAEPGIGPLVPSEMRERYELRMTSTGLGQRPAERVEGVATYSRFRQFQVKVDEKIAPIKH